MTADLTPGHGGNAGLCTDDHICSGCEVGGACSDLFEHPICGVVACCADAATGDESGFAPILNTSTTHVKDRDVSR